MLKEILVIDDNPDILEECEHYGILGYHVDLYKGPNPRKRYHGNPTDKFSNPYFTSRLNYLKSNDITHPSFSSFTEAVEQLISDHKSGALLRKLSALDHLVPDNIQADRHNWTLNPWRPPL